YYRPYRERVEQSIGEAISAHSPIVHVSVHSFTPVLRGQIRTADIGLLYDPQHRGEMQFCAAWRHHLLALRPALRGRRNSPSRGVSDGLTTYLRRRFGADYFGIELEVNQRWPRRRTAWRTLQNDLLESLRRTLSDSR